MATLDACNANVLNKAAHGVPDALEGIRDLLREERPEKKHPATRPRQLTQRVTAGNFAEIATLRRNHVIPTRWDLSRSK